MKEDNTYYWSIKRNKYVDYKTGEEVKKDAQHPHINPLEWFFNLYLLTQKVLKEKTNTDPFFKRDIRYIGVSKNICILFEAMEGFVPAPKEIDDKIIGSIKNLIIYKNDNSRDEVKIFGIPGEEAKIVVLDTEKSFLCRVDEDDKITKED